MENAFLSVLSLSFKASFLILAVVFVRLVLRRSPRYIICLMWLLVGLRLVLPFSVESTLSLIPQNALSSDYSVSSQVIASNTIIEDNIPIQEYIPATNTDIENDTATDAAFPLDNPVQPTTQDNSAAPLPSQPSKASLTVLQIGCIIWLCGLGLMLGYLVVSFAILRRHMCDALPVSEGVWQSGRVRSPFVLGFFRPRIYVSRDMSEEHAAYVLSHERAHIARRDHWTKPIGFVILALHWFNPLVWLAYILLCRDIELACDERVIKNMDLQSRKGYSEALLLCAVKASPLAACPLAFGEVSVKHRIKSVLHYKKPAFWIVLAAIACCVAAAVLFLTDPKSEQEFYPLDAKSAVSANIHSGLSGEELSIEQAHEVNALASRLAEISPSDGQPSDHGYNGYLYKLRVKDADGSVYKITILDSERIQFEDVDYTYDASEIITYIDSLFSADEIKQLYQRYANAAAEGFDAGAQYCWFASEQERELALEASAGQRLESYDIISVTRVNDKLYELMVNIDDSGAEPSRLVQNFVGFIDGEWLVIRNYDNVPEQIAGGLESIDKLNYEDALGTIQDTLSVALYVPEGGWESGRVIDYRPSYPSGTAQSESKIFRFADISERAAAIINSGNLAEYGNLEFTARMSAVTSNYSTAVQFNRNEYKVEFIKDEMGYYISARSGENAVSYYYAEDSATEEEIELLIKNAPQEVYLDVDDLNEYTLSNGLALGMSYNEIVSIMGTPDSIEKTQSDLAGSVMYSLDYPGAALLYTIASLGESVENSSLYFIQIFSEDILTSRRMSTGSSWLKVRAAYGLERVEITGDDEFLPVVQNLGIHADDYYDSVFAITPQDQSYWNTDDWKAYNLIFLFKDDKLECIYLRYAVAIDFQPTLAKPSYAPPTDAVYDTGSGYPLRIPMGTSVVTDLNGDGVQEVIQQTRQKNSLFINGESFYEKVRELGINISNPHLDYYYITDLDTRDNTLEITLYDEGPSGDPEVHFLRYDGENLIYLGSVPEWFERIEFGGFGVVSGTFRMHILHTWRGYGSWQLGGNGKLELIPQEVYYSTSTHTYDFSNGGKLLEYHPLLSDVYAYTSKSLDSDKIVLGVHDEIKLIGTDLEEWILAETKLGNRYWLHLTDNYYLDIPPSGATYADNVIMYLNHAD